MLLVLATSLIFTAGCGMGTPAAAGNGLSESATTGGLTGKALGGQVPIVNGAVYAFIAGKTGYGVAGSGATPVGVASTDANGNFSFSAGNPTPNAISCGGGGTLYLYLYGGSGGSSATNASANTQSLLMAVLGDCATVVAANPFVNINEISTYAAMTAMQAFFNPTAATYTPVTGTLALGTAENFSTSSTNALGLANAAATAANLFNTSTNVSGVSTAVGPTASSIAITGYSITSNVASFTTATQSPAFTSTEQVYLSGFPASTFLNGTLVTVSATGLSTTGFQAPVTHTNVAATATVSAYSVTGSTVTLTANTSFAAGQTVTFGGFTGGLTFLNGNAYTVLAAGLTSTTFEVTAPGGTGSGSDSGTATATVETGAVAPGASVTITPESTKLLSAANVLATCVNSLGGGGTPCATLFSSVEPSTSSVVIGDTLQAAYFMASNPLDSTDGTAGGTSNMTTVYGLITANGKAFSGDLTVQPIDWTLGIAYTSSSKCSGGGQVINDGYDVAIDATDDVWLVNGAGTTDSLFQMSPAGISMACSGVIDALQGGSAGSGSRGGAAIDTNGNVWAASGTTGTATALSYVSKYVPGTGVTTQVNDPNAVAAKTYAITADGNGNVFFTDAATAANGGLKLYEVTSGATTATLINTGNALPSTSPFGVEVDTKGTVIVSQSSGSSTTITGFPTTLVGGSVYPASGTPLTQVSGYAGTVDLAFDANGAFWVANNGGSTGAENTTSATTITYGSSTPGAANSVTFNAPSAITAAGVGGISTPRHDAIDGNNNIWLANNTAPTGVTELLNKGTSTAPVALSPNTGGFAKTTGALPNPHGIAIDGSGNVWVSNFTSATLGEIVGLAGPVVTPHSIALQNNVLGTKP
jgi:hypothetical protein